MLNKLRRLSDEAAEWASTHVELLVRTQLGQHFGASRQRLNGPWPFCSSEFRSGGTPSTSYRRLEWRLRGLSSSSPEDSGVTHVNKRWRNNARNEFGRLSVAIEPIFRNVRGRTDAGCAARESDQGAPVYATNCCCAVEKAAGRHLPKRDGRPGRHRCTRTAVIATSIAPRLIQSASDRSNRQHQSKTPATTLDLAGSRNKRAGSAQSALAVDAGTPRK